MNKQDAAAFLGVSTRTLESYVTNKGLTCTYVKGKTRPVADFDPDELAAFKEKLSSDLRPAVAVKEIAQPTSQNLAVYPAESRNNVAAQFREIRDSTGKAVIVISPENLAELARVIIETTKAEMAQTAQNGESRNIETDPSRLAAKQWLSIDEAVHFVGASKNLIRTALASGDLTGALIGRGWKMTPSDLTTWSRKYHQSRIAKPATAQK